MTNAEQWAAAEDANGKGVTDLRRNILALDERNRLKARYEPLDVLRSATLRASFQDGQP